MPWISRMADAPMRSSASGLYDVASETRRAPRSANGVRVADRAIASNLGPAGLGARPEFLERGNLQDLHAYLHPLGLGMGGEHVLCPCLHQRLAGGGPQVEVEHHGEALVHFRIGRSDLDVTHGIPRKPE